MSFDLLLANMVIAAIGWTMVCAYEEGTRVLSIALAITLWVQTASYVFQMAIN